MDQWLASLATQYGYIGIFLVSLIGACSIVFPIPYTILIFTFGRILNPLLVAVASGAGSALGEIIGYALGYCGRSIASEEQKKKMSYFLRVFSRYGALTIFLFALTPLPDDLLFIPLGIMRYSLLKAFIPCLLGKTLMSFILAYGGYLSIGFIENIFGGNGGIATTIITTILLAIIIVIIFKVDWEKAFPLKEKDKKP